MVFTVLDIGAGSLEFARRFARKNWSKRMLIFGGEPRWNQFSLPRNIVSGTEAARFMAHGRIGEYRIVSKYDSFAFANNSLDMVTLNAPAPPFGLPFGVETELERCLKPGGMFFYAYPLLFYPIPLPSHFECLSEGFWSEQGSALQLDKVGLPCGAPTKFPASRTIRWNLKMQWFRVHDPQAYEYYFARTGRSKSSCVYWKSGVHPGFQLWIKH